MTKNYAQLQSQIKALEKQAEAVRAKEIAGVISRIKEAIKEYGLTATDLGLGKATPKAKKTGKAAKPGKAKSNAKKVAVAYRDEAGNIWGGRGPRPAWLRAALAAGKSLQDFAA